MALPHKLKNMNLFFNGDNWQGKAEEITLPKLTRKLEAYRAGGMNGAAHVDLGLEDDALGMEMTLGGMEAQLYKQWGIAEIDGVPLRFAGAYQRDDTGEVTACEVVVRGRLSEIDPGSAKQGDNTQVKFSFKPTYYRLVWNGADLIEIDVVNMVEKVDGVDRLAEQRAAIGL
ncbi:phage major tail tube protein [Morganella morganii]|uniref:phage major tail tube protein n=1 Tax=Morganella morganii TaxID=582 RepID=UPI00069C7EC0|nr:phage major tail tube protein [Morganella morganii]HDU8650737.1 phage major tail tube protein [Morganella morganii subsp. morganii]KNZ82903.1 major tail tube protein [Morganella morganii]HCT8190550.1 phage major tail tube protein [Morganella morganii]HEI8515279.1 phage major tail tube protein [Morganella morganii]HEJ1050104.1 phage major tail tube protein [Morganella morganii]